MTGKHSGRTDSTVSRRRFLTTTAVAGGALTAGQAAAQETNDGSSEGGGAVNIGDADTITDADEVRFDASMPVGELTQLFIEYDTPEHPVIGTDINFQGVVLNAVTTDEDRTNVSNNLDWSNFEWEGDRILDPLFEPMSWVSSNSVTLDSAFYDEHQLIRIAGIEQQDQRFYDRYGFVPYVWTVIPAGETVTSGTVVDVTATVNYAGTDTSSVDFGSDGGVYLDSGGLTQRGELTTLTESTSIGERASFLGAQLRGQPRLTTELTNLDYTYETEYPRPAGGSVVTHQGQIESNELGSGTDTASMMTTRQNIVVGDTRPGQWDSGGQSNDDGETAEFTNTVAVLDTSGSMGDSDTVSGDSRIAVARQSARSLVNFVGNGNRLGVVEFDQGASTVSSLQTVTDDSRQAMRAEIDRLRSSGDTSIGAGLQEALEMLRGASGPKSIILLSDGEHNEAPAPSSVLPELKSLGVTIYTIGMGSSADEQLLRQLANETGGQTAMRPQPGQIRQVFQQFSISAQNRSQITSKQAELTEGETVSGSATVDGSCDEVQFSLTYPGSTITLQPQKPNGEALSEGGDVTRRVGETSEIWTVENPETGDWKFTMTGEQLSRPEEATTEVSADSPIDAELFLSDFHYDQTGMYRVELKATNGRERYTGADVTLEATNGEETTEIDLRDDRGGPDPVANDGLYTGYFHPTETGEYVFQASISGGEVEELQRDFTRQLQVDQVVDPIRPYRNREPIKETKEESVGLLGRLQQLAPVGAALVVVALAVGLWKRIRGGGGETAGGTQRPPGPGTGNQYQPETGKGNQRPPGANGGNQRRGGAGRGNQQRPGTGGNNRRQPGTGGGNRRDDR